MWVERARGRKPPSGREWKTPSELKKKKKKKPGDCFCPVVFGFL